MKIAEILKKSLIGLTMAATVVGMSGCGTKEVESSAKEEVSKESESKEEVSKETKEESKKEEKKASALDKDVLVVGLDDTFAPMGFKDEKGELVGLDIDIAKALGEKLGKKIEFQAIDWSMKESELNAGNIDFIWNGYSITDERKEQVAFGTPYLKNRQIILTLADSDIQTKADLKGKTVGAQTGSSAVDAIESDPETEATFKDGKPVTYESNNDVLMELEAGRIDAAVSDEILIRYYISKKDPSKFRILDEDFGEEEYGVGMRKEDTDLVAAFNKAYAELKADGTLKEISIKWFGEDISE